MKDNNGMIMLSKEEEEEIFEQLRKLMEDLKNSGCSDEEINEKIKEEMNEKLKGFSILSKLNIYKLILKEGKKFITVCIDESLDIFEKVIDGFERFDILKDRIHNILEEKRKDRDIDMKIFNKIKNKNNNCEYK
jgi:hypothetical protein